MRCRPAIGLSTAWALPPPSPCSTTSGASMPRSASMSPPAAASKNLRASSSPSARRDGGGALPGPGEDLTAVHLGLAGDPRHIRVAVPEHLAQHEHRPLHRRKGLEQ